MRASLQEIATESDFPEDRYLPRHDLAEGYFAAVRRGRIAMRRTRIVICGLARNVSRFLPPMMARIERLGSLFADYRVLIYENDSTDDTAWQLEQWSAANDRIVAISRTRDKPRHESIRCLNRAADMAEYRAECQAEVAARWSDFEQVCVVDTDLPGGFSYDGVAHSFGSEGWDFVGSYGIVYQRQRLSPHIALHYDVWAYRVLGRDEALDGRAGNALSWRRGEPLLPVDSCFGGLGLYRMPAWLAGRYGGGDCEHVVLHRSMRAAGYGRGFLNPNQIVLYGRKKKCFDSLVLSLDRVVRAVSAICALA